MVAAQPGWPSASQYDRAAEAPVPVSQYTVMLSRMWSRVRPPDRWWPSASISATRSLARVAVSYPSWGLSGRQAEDELMRITSQHVTGLVQEAGAAAVGPDDLTRLTGVHPSRG